MDSKIELLVDFLQQRITHLVDFQRANTAHDRWLAGCRVTKPCLPKTFRYYGDMEHFPPSLHAGECCVIIANHQSDLDPAYLMALMHTQYLQRPVASANAQAYLTVNATAFTHSHFFKQPVLGPLLTKANLIGLHSGMTDEEMQLAIADKLDQGINTFVLFPEGGVHSKSNHEKSKAYWKQTQEGVYPFKNCFMPKSRCYTNLIHTLGNRLRYLCDITMLYPQHQPWKLEWNYDVKPSVVYSCTEQLSTVSVHCKIIDLKDQQHEAISRPEALLKLWRKKEKRLEVLRAQETLLLAKQQVK